MSIDNKTILNTSLFTFLSSGAVDVWMAHEASINNQPLPLVPEKVEKIQTGDRFTIFLEELFANTFLVNLEMLGEHSTVFINFQTTKDYSFSLHHFGNRHLSFNIDFGRGTEKWGTGNVKNLEKYFEGYPEDQVLNFDVMIHKSSSYKYTVELDVTDPADEILKIFYLPNTKGINTDVGQCIANEPYTILQQIETNIKPQGLQKCLYWNTESDGSGYIYNFGDIIFPQTDIKLYAIWQDIADTEDITLEFYDEIYDSYIYKSIKFGVLPNTIFIIPDVSKMIYYKWYTFQYWKDEKNNIYATGDEVLIENSKIFTAVYKAKEWILNTGFWNMVGFWYSHATWN